MKKVITFLIVFCLLLGGTFSVQAQTPIAPGDPAIRSELVRPSHSFYKNTITDSGGKVLYDFMMEDVILVDTPGKRLIFARYRQVPLGSFSTDTSVTDFQLKPIRMHEIHYQRDVSYDMTFDQTEATVVTVRKGVRSVKSYPMKRGYFEDNMIEYIFGYLDLRKGERYILDNFNKDAPAPSDPYILEYAFDDVLDPFGGGRLDCRVLHFLHGKNSGYIWIDKASRDVLKELGSYKGIQFVIQKH